LLEKPGREQIRGGWCGEEEESISAVDEGREKKNRRA